MTKSLITMLVVFSCFALSACKKQRLAFKKSDMYLDRKNYKDIQGNWRLQNMTIDLSDSTHAYLFSGCYFDYTIKEVEDPDGKKRLHLFSWPGATDFGNIIADMNGYQQLSICNANMNIHPSLGCQYNPMAGKCINWSLVRISEGALRLKYKFNNHTYEVLYVKF